MTLTLTITNVDKLDNGVATRLRLDRHGALIGRSPQADWCLPDPQAYISSTHCEIDYRGGDYILADKSTNGVFVNGSQTRVAGPHVIADGDQIAIGSYIISARLEGSGAQIRAPEAKPEWQGWGNHETLASSAPAAAGWDTPAPRPAISGMGAMSGNWTPPRAEAPPPPAPSRDTSVWATPAAPVTPASAWSSPLSDVKAPPSAVDVWGKLAEGNAVDWSRGGFGAAPAPVALAATPVKDPLGLDRTAPPPASDAWGAAPREPSAWREPSRPTATPHPAAPAPMPTPNSAPMPPSAGAWAAFLSGSGLSAADVRSDPGAAMASAGDLLRRLIAGMVVMLEARARAKAQLGAQGTALSFDGNNPLKFARSPERALAQLLNAPERGFMPADRAIEDAFRDLQAHQMATLAAMQGALAATLARFSPQSIRERAEMRGILAKILPAARDAELWKAYEREFEGVARGSDEAFMDVFAKEFRKAYEKSAADMKGRA